MSNVTVFNQHNDGFKTGEYPIFLGQPLGIFDTINVRYPELEELYQKQLAQIWNEHEVELSQDRMDMATVDQSVVDLMVFTISYQYLVDSVAAKSISSVLLQHCTNSEAEGLLTVQAFFEVIHARTYSHIIKQTFLDPNDMIAQTYANTEVLRRAGMVVEIFEELANLPADASEEEKRQAILLVIAVLMGLEAVSFMGSFLVTFAIAETDVFQGIAKLVGLICRDEVLHARMDYAILSALLKDPLWYASFQAVKSRIVDVFNETRQREHDFADYLFSNGRQMVGLNAPIIKEYVDYLAYPLYGIIGAEAPFAQPKENPCPLMDKYINPAEIQAAAQEIQITSYRVGSVLDDLNTLDLGEWA